MRRSVRPAASVDTSHLSRLPRRNASPPAPFGLRFPWPRFRLTCLKVYNPLPQTMSPSIAIYLRAADRTGNRR